MKTVIDVAMSCLGTPYVYGGSNPMTGMDCSGFIQWVLSTCGVDPIGDQTAQGLFDAFNITSRWNRYVPGALAFYGKSVTQITHVALLIDGYRIIEAAGGDSTTLTKEDAAKRGACVRVRLINQRKDLVAVIFPSYAKIGIP